MSKEKFIIEPHFRLQEWVAEEKGYFKDEGLDYVFQELIKSTDGAHHYKGDKVGAMQSFERGRTSNVSCACHWTVGVAASKGNGRLYAGVYSVAPSGVFVPQDSPVRKPEDLAGVPIAVGYQSGSHYSTIQALEQFMPRAQARATRHRSAPRSLYPLLQERVPHALPRHDGHAPLGSGRAPRVRDLHQGGLRGDLQMDRRPRHLRRQRNGLGYLRGRRHRRGALGADVIGRGLRA